MRLKERRSRMSSSPTIIGFDGCPMVRRHGLTRRWNGGTGGIR